MTSREEYAVNRKKRIFRVLGLVGVSPKCYEEAVREQTQKGVNIILARDIDEMYINNYNPGLEPGMQTLISSQVLTSSQS